MTCKNKTNNYLWNLHNLFLLNSWLWCPKFFISTLHKINFININIQYYVPPYYKYLKHDDKLKNVLFLHVMAKQQNHNWLHELLCPCHWQGWHWTTTVNVWTHKLSYNENKHNLNETNENFDIKIIDYVKKEFYLQIEAIHQYETQRKAHSTGSHMSCKDVQEHDVLYPHLIHCQLQT